MITKTKLPFQTAAALLLLVVSVAAASAQPASPSNPPSPPSQPAVNPATGLPEAAPAPAAPQWIDSNWRDPSTVLTNLSYDNLPASEVAKDLREKFKNDFDILPMPSTYGQDWGSQISIQLQLRNVKASEIFNAMNLVFENDRTPVRWELKWTGGRPIVQLRVLPEAAPQPEPPQPKRAETHRQVFFVGHLVGDEKTGGMTMEQIVKTIEEVWPADFGKPEGVIQFHKDAQLLVANGTREQLEFINQTLAALGQKTVVDTDKRISADLQSRLDGAKNQKTNSPDAK